MGLSLNCSQYQTALNRTTKITRKNHLLQHPTYFQHFPCQLTTKVGSGFYLWREIYGMYTGLSLNVTPLRTGIFMYFILLNIFGENLQLQSWGKYYKKTYLVPFNFTAFSENRNRKRLNNYNLYSKIRISWDFLEWRRLLFLDPLCILTPIFFFKFDPQHYQAGLLISINKVVPWPPFRKY